MLVFEVCEAEVRAGACRRRLAFVQSYRLQPSYKTQSSRCNSTNRDVRKLGMDGSLTHAGEFRSSDFPFFDKFCLVRHGLVGGSKLIRTYLLILGEDVNQCFQPLRKFKPQIAMSYLWLLR